MVSWSTLFTTSKLERLHCLVWFLCPPHLQICVLTTTAATTATPPAWRAARWDRGKVPTSPAPREYATTTKRVGFRRAAESLTIARSHSLRSWSSMWPRLLPAGDDLHVDHCAADKEEDGTDSCVDCWPHPEGIVQSKSKKKKRKGQNLCSSQVSERSSEQAESPAVFGSEAFDWPAAFSTGNEGGRPHTRREHAAVAHVPHQRRLVLLFTMWPHGPQPRAAVAMDGEWEELWPSHRTARRKYQPGGASGSCKIKQWLECRKNHFCIYVLQSD